MRFMTLIRAAEDVRATPELYEAIGRYSEEMVRSGVLVARGGLRPSAQGARLRLARGRIAVTDGPFTEAKEVIGGYAILEAPSREAAVEHARRFLQIHADTLGPSFECECEVRGMEGGPEGAAG